MTDRVLWLLTVLYLCVPSSRGQGLPKELRDEIASHRENVERIVDYVLNGDGQHGMYNQLAVFSDDYGPRLSGSDDLERAIDYVEGELRTEGYNVTLENVNVRHWTRGEEQGAIEQPRYHKISIFTLGSSVGTTGAGGLTAEVIVVKSFQELIDRQTEVPGKIVVYNEEWVGYPDTVPYRSAGASEASRFGAVAALVKSVTPYSIYSNHLGHQTYADDITPIPVACITVEDAERMQRLVDRNIIVTVNLNMTCESLPDVVSRNIIAEYPGSEKPNEYVIIGGHIDSWDVGYGVLDDGGGVIMSWQVLRILKDLGLQPKRTVRTIFWTGEEWGLIGADAYFAAHKAENDSISLIMESDSGTFSPYGIGFTGSGYARAIMEEVALLLDSINATAVGLDGNQPDTGMWIEIGVPGGALYHENSKYFYYHHSHGDSVTMEDPRVLDLCTAVWAATTYVIANLNDKLPRTGEHPGYPDPSFGSKVTASTPLIMLLAVLCLMMVKRNH